MAEDKQTESKDPKSIGDVVEGLDELAEENDDKVCFGDVLDKFGSRSFAPVMLILAILELTPVGAIPGVPTALAICIALVAVQMAIGKDHIWVPGFVEKIAVSSDKLGKGTDKIEGVADKMDSLAKGRLEFLTKGVGLQVAAVAILILCVAVAPLELLPWASMFPMLAISMISLAIMVRDGLAMLIAWIFAAAALGAAAFYWFGTGGGGG